MQMGARGLRFNGSYLLKKSFTKMLTVRHHSNDNTIRIDDITVSDERRQDII